MSRRNRKIRRRLKMTLNHGHEVRHRLISGRTGGVHSKKLRSPKKYIPTGEVKVLVGPYTFKPHKPHILKEEPVLKIDIIQKPKKTRVRRILTPIAVEVEPVVEDPSTAVDFVSRAYSYCLLAVAALSHGDLLPGSREARLMFHLNSGIEEFEKRQKRSLNE